MKQITQHNDNCHALVLGGGGARRVAYSGALEALNLGKFDLVVGTSVGAVVAMLIALGVDKSHIRYFCEVDSSHLLSQNTIELYHGNGAAAALAMMAQDDEYSGANRSTALRQLLLHEISSRLQHLFHYLFEHDLLATGQCRQNLAVIDKQKWATSKNRVAKVKTALLQWIKQPDTLTFSDLDGLRRLLARCGVDAQLKRLLVTTTRIDHNATMSPCVMGIRAHSKMMAADDEIRIIDAVLASCAFPGLYRPLTISGNMRDRFCDGGIFDHQPTHLGIRYLSDPRYGRVVSLMLHPVKRLIRRRDNPVLGWAGQGLFDAMNAGFRCQFGAVVAGARLGKVDRDNNKVIQRFAKARLFELDLKSDGIDILSLSPSAKQKADALNYAREVVIGALAHTTLLA